MKAEYLILKPGDYVLRGDEWYDERDKTWNPTTADSWGTAVAPGLTEYYRRRMATSEHCVNHSLYGCDLDAIAEMRDIYKGDELLKTAPLCQACRAELISRGLELILPDKLPKS